VKKKNLIRKNYTITIKCLDSLRHFLPRGATFTMAWSKALHSIRQAKYIGKRKNETLG
jgi:Mn-containing catalase